MTRLAVMRPPEKMDVSVEVARSLGFEPVCASPLHVVTNEDHRLGRFIQELMAGKVDIIVLTSSTGVKALFDLASPSVGPQELTGLMQKVTTVAIGPLTAQAMRSQGVQVSFVPTVYSSEGLVSQLDELSVKGKKVYVLRSDHGERVLIEAMRKAGARVVEVVVYRLIKQLDSQEMRSLAQECLEGGIDAYAFTSSLSALSFLESASIEASREEVIAAINRKVVAAVGMPTKKRLEENGIRVEVVPANATFEEMLRALKAYIDTAPQR
jgi:uroporphyrinogen-III synthase